MTLAPVLRVEADVAIIGSGFAGSLMALELSLPKGQKARLLATDGEQATLLASVAFPPGTPLELALPDATVRVKVRACKRTAEDAELPFRIEGRFQNLSRELRERLLAARAPGL